MSGSIFFEGNGYFDASVCVNSTLGSSRITTSDIRASTIDMLSTGGNYQNITNVRDPVNPQDAATKQYVDDLGIVISTATVVGTTGTLIHSNLKGSYVITISNLVNNGPSGVFHVTKSEAPRHAHVVRTAAAPGVSTNVGLAVTWPPNSGIYLNKTGAGFDGSYRVKIM